MSVSAFAYFVAGLVFLLLGAELLVRGASRLAVALGISPLVIGLTVVAWGTGSPELAVGLKAAVAGQPDLALGNVVGSNIANVLLILGVAAVIVPLQVSQRVVRLDVPLMIAASILTLLLGLDGTLGTLDGLLFLALLLAYTAWTVHGSRRARRAVLAEYEREFGDAEGPPAARPWTRYLLHTTMVVGGLFLLVRGSDWLVVGASALAEALGFSQLIIGLTIVAIGTSLPELATSAVAGFRGERDIAVGNAIGSNLFNILAVLGAAAVAAPGGIRIPPPALSVDIPIMIAVAVACLPVFFENNVIHRWNGAVFLGLYAGYLVYLVLDATERAALTGFTWLMLAFVLPLVAFTLILVAVQHWRRP